MVRQHLDDAAYGDAAMNALLDHRFQLTAQRDQTGGSVFGVGEVCPCNRVSLVAGLLRQPMQTR